MGRCEKLKWNRRKMGLSQREFADKVGLSVGTISRLELDETTWETMQDATFDKINSIFTEENLWPIKSVNGHEETEAKVEEKKTEVEHAEDISWGEKVVLMLNQNDSNEKDKKTLDLLTFAMDGLKEAENHDEFVANIKLIKRILKDY